jgi:hypothetical protein
MVEALAHVARKKISKFCMNRKLMALRLRFANAAKQP